MKTIINKPFSFDSLIEAIVEDNCIHTFEFDNASVEIEGQLKKCGEIVINSVKVFSINSEIILTVEEKNKLVENIQLSIIKEQIKKSKDF